MADEQQLRSYLKRVTIELAEERKRSHATRYEPIAIVGMACRYPGEANDPEQLWRLLSDDKDAIAEFPDDRGWDLEHFAGSTSESPLSGWALAGGFVQGAVEFDPGFFGISAREALAMDPQQRLLLEVAWEALERAAVPPTSLHGSATGVFIGVMHHEYGHLLLNAPEDLGAFRSAGAASSVASGRISYALGLEGPAITVDTACSSSLVAMHLAAQALRQGECSLALAGGASVLASPHLFAELGRIGTLAPDGRCKSFAEAADGAGFSEGVGMLVLERLSDAHRNGHEVLATIKGSAVNQDGASNGLTAPNGPSQERVIRQALANARLTPQDIDAVEAHGTGTTLGDPIEAGALLATYGQERDEPLLLGSIKSNIGHTQAAAGVAGVIKMTLALREGVLPQTLHLDAPSSKVDWEAGQIELLGEAKEWKPKDRPRRAGISSFGISGTNAHVILEEAPQPAAVGGGGRAEQESGVSSKALPGPIPLVLSARSEPALQDQAARLGSHLRQNPELDPTDVAYSLATTRSSFEHRAVALGEGREALLDSLAVLAEGGDAPGTARGIANPQRPVFLFPGQGSQWEGMALDLIEASPSFAQHIAECEQALAPHVDWSLTEVLAEEGGAWMERLDIVQPALFAVMVSLARLWQELGVQPSVVVGHSQGEIAAAHVAGALSLEDAALIVAERGKAMAKIAGAGAMLSVSLSPKELEPLLEPYGDRVSVAAINGPASLALSGEPGALTQLMAECKAEGIRSQPIAVDYAAHSAQIDALKEELLEAFAPIEPRSGQIPMHSTLTAEPVEGTELDADYWFSNLRQTVLLEPVLASLFEQGQRTLIEIGPHPVLAFAVQESAEAHLPETEQATVLGTLRRDEGGPTRFALSLAQAHAAGVPVEWEAFFKGTKAKRVSLPTYPFQRKRFWIEAGNSPGDLSSTGLASAEHPLLSAVVEDPRSEALTLTGRISLATHPWLADHAVAGAVLLPGTAFVELGLRAAEQAGAETISELTLQAPLILGEQGAVQIQVSVSSPGEEGEREVSIHSRPEEEEAEWTHNAQGLLSQEAPQVPDPLTAWPPEGAEPIETEDVYERFADIGVEYGPAFQGLTAAWRQGAEIYAEVSLPEELAEQARGFGIHPALLDAALHGIGLLDAEELGAGDGPLMPFAWGGVTLAGSGAGELRVRLGSGEGSVSLSAYDREGAPLARVDSLAVRAVDTSQLQAAGRGPEGLLTIEWQPHAPGPDAGETPVEVWHSEDGGPDAGAACTVARAALEAIQSHLADADPEQRLAIVTREAVAVSGEEVPDPAGAAVWGLARVAIAEHPGRFALVDLDGTEASLANLQAAFEAGADEPQLALRGGELYVPRLVRYRGAPEGGVAVRPIDPDSTVLVTGGAAGRGAQVARHLVAVHGVRHLLLTESDGEGDGVAELVEELRGLEAEVTVASCDVADRVQVEELLASIPGQHPLGAVIHATRTLDGDLLEGQDPDRLERAMKSNVEAAWNLHELTEDLDLSQFVLFSSAASILGNIGLGSHAAASAFLDALAAHRQGRELPGTALAWGLWEAEGDRSAALDEASRARLRRVGLAPIAPDRALELFDVACELGEPLLVPAEVELAPLRAEARAGTLPPVLRSLVRLRGRRNRVAGPLAVRLAAVSEAERATIVLELVGTHVAAVLGRAEEGEVDPDRAFSELGLDSLGAVELRNRLVAATGLGLPASLVFDYPSVRALSDFLEKQATDAGRESSGVHAGGPPLDEPIAIVGMACRYPGGVSSPQGLLNLVISGTEAAGDVPTDRGWNLDRLPADPSGASIDHVGFVEGVPGFDPGFFGISPREAAAIDPQQRLLLEISWEAMEDAGVDPRSLHGSPTGVYAGVGNSGYGALLEKQPSGQIGGLAVGASASVVSGRVAYTFGFEGPAISIDTACSSSLVALHLASQALRQGECTLALAGGVQVIATVEGADDLNMPGGLAADGRCKSFADAADGTGFSEGVGMLVLERLSDAERNGHRVLALIKGSAVNQDGASNGLTAPNGPSQERVIRQALANARLTPQDIDAVEAHGTGTTLGDPIEAGALLATYGQDREQPLLLGSIKSNIGHTAIAAGVAGVIKMTLAIREGILPQTLHVDRPTSRVDWGSGKVELLTRTREWRPEGRPRRAGVSSFGVSGTNAHLILEEAPPRSGKSSGLPVGGGGAAAFPPAPTPLALSAKSDAALRDAAKRLGSRLEAEPELDLADVGFTLAIGRAHLERRAAILATDREGALAGLSALALGGEAPGLVHGSVKSDRRPVFLFPGHGAHWPGMAVELQAGSPAFAAKLAECEEALEPHIEWSFEEVLHGDADAMPAERLDIVQPMLWSVLVSLAELWRAAGVEPAVVVGQSQGEIAAAHIAGALSIEDAAAVVAKRSRILLQLVGEGRMVSVRLPAERLRAQLEEWDGRIEIAALTGPASTVLAGEGAALDELMRRLEGEGVRTTEIRSAVAPSHSSFVEPLREELLEALATISPRSTEIPFHSTVTGEVLDTRQLDAEYWYRNMREPVLLEPVLRSLLDRGLRGFVEVGPHPVLGLGVQETVDAVLDSPGDAAVLGTLRRGEGGPARFALSLAEAHAQGVAIDWSTFYAGSGAEQVSLPTYPFQRKRYWLEAGRGEAGNLEAAGLDATDHPILAAAIDDPAGGGHIFTGRIAVGDHRWIADHAVGDTALLSSAVFAELALQAGQRLGAETLVELDVEVPIGLEERDAVVLRMAVTGPGEDGSRSLTIHSRVESSDDLVDGPEWTCNARGVLSPGAAGDAGDFDLGAWPPEGAEPLDVARVYDGLEGAGLELGPAYRGVQAGWRQDDRVFAEVGLAGEQAEEASRFAIHPALLDAVVQFSPELVGEAGASGRGDGHAVALPQAWSHLRLHRSGVEAVRVRIGEAQGRVTLVAVDEHGQPVLSIGGIDRRPLPRESLRAGRLQRSLYRLEWPELRDASSPIAVSRLAVLGDGDPGLPEAERHPDTAALLVAMGSDSAAPEVVVVDVRGQTGDLPEAAHAGARRALELLQAWLSEERLRESRLVFLTAGALAPHPGESPDLGAAPVRGMLQAAHAEHPGRFALVDVDDAESSGRVLPHALALGESEPQLAIREGRLLMPRAARAKLGEGPASRPIDPERTVLITGGTSGIGALIARHLVVEHGARHLLLASRSGSNASGATELEAELAGLGAEIAIAACDVADREQLEALLESIPPEQPLGAVIHSAGVLDNTVIEALDADRLERVMRPKVDAAWHLHELTKDLDLGQFVLFSSFASIVSGSSQANYVAANAFLDLLASYRSAEGLPATAIAWGRWEQGTTLLDESQSESAHALMERLGFLAMSSEEGLALFDAACVAGDSLLAPALLEGATLRGLADAGVLPPVLRGLVRASAQGEQLDGSLRTRLDAASEDEREALLVELVRGLVARVLGHASADDVDPERNLQEMGFDSLSTVELRGRLSTAIGISIPMQALTTSPTVESVARHLLAELSRSTTGSESPASEKEATTLVALLAAARERGDLGGFADFLSTASGFRPSFESGASAGPLPVQVHLSEGVDAPALYLMASAGATSGSHEYVRFAKGFRGIRDVIAQPLPGFAEGEALPASVSALSEALAETIVREDPERPFVLGGHSSGGWVAHAVAAQLESAGIVPSAVLLLDTFWPSHELLTQALPIVLAGMDEAGRAGVVLDDTRLTAMGAYFRIFTDWRPEELVAPTVMVRASEPGRDGTAGFQSRVSWELTHTCVDVRGDHFSMMSEWAEPTARAVQEMLGAAPVLPKT